MATLLKVLINLADIKSAGDVALRVRTQAADDDEHIMLTDAAGHSIRRELIEFIKDLDVDEAAAWLRWLGSVAATCSPRNGKSR
jgi:hypothetical protein